MKQELFGRERVCASFMNLRENGKTLNIGSGEIQWIENFLFKDNENFISSDSDRKNLGEHNKAKNKMLIDAENIGIENSSISQVIILDVLEHLKNDERAVQEIYRIMKQNGDLLVCVPNDTILSYLNPVRHVQHERHYSVKGISSLLEKNGFKIEKIFAGGGIFELISLYIHFLIKFTVRKIVNPSFLNKLRDLEYKEHSGSGNEIIIKARKIQ